MNWLTHDTVAVAKDEAAYSDSPPFHPSASYAEAPFRELGPDNPAYRAVRMAFDLAGFDSQHVGSHAWNPLGQLVRPGDTVLLKPNWLRAPLPQSDDVLTVITHGSVIRAVADYVVIALQGRGRIVIADGPQTDSDFPGIVQRSGMDSVVRYLSSKGIDVRLLDLRRHRWDLDGDVVRARHELPGDPSGYAHIELAKESAFESYGLNGKFYGADYDDNDTATFHGTGHHEYVLCRTPMEADVVINIPKLKTHKKVGVTLALKALVGINGYRNCLPHHTSGTPRHGGDEFPTDSLKHRLESRATLRFKHLLKTMGGTGGRWAVATKSAGRTVFGATSSVVRQGNWYGNDTAWRMVLDLNRAFLHFDSSGDRRREPRRYLCIVDGLVGGDGNGPAHPSKVPAGALILGMNPVAVDSVATRLMGFDDCRIPMIATAWSPDTTLPLSAFLRDSVRVAMPAGGVCGLADVAPLKPRFRPHFGWTGRIELEPADLGQADT